MTLPDGWHPADPPSGVDKDLLADMVFFARDPQSTDPEFFSTVLVMQTEPADDPHEYLDRQEAALQPPESAPESVAFSRITLPAGEALVFQITSTDGRAQIQYYLPTAQAIFAIWFTTPLAELATRKPQLEKIARSFRLKT